MLDRVGTEASPGGPYKQLAFSVHLECASLTRRPAGTLDHASHLVEAASVGAQVVPIRRCHPSSRGVGRSRSPAGAILKG